MSDMELFEAKERIAELERKLAAVTAERDRMRYQVKRMSAPISNVEQGDFLAGICPADEEQRRKVMNDKHKAFCMFRGIDALIAARAALRGEEEESK